MDDQLNLHGNLPDSHLIGLALLQEALSIDSEHWFWSKLQADYSSDFPQLPHLTRYNRRRKRLAGWIHRLARLWGRQLRPGEDTYMVDSIPVLVAHIAREFQYGLPRAV